MLIFNKKLTYGEIRLLINQNSLSRIIISCLYYLIDHNGRYIALPAGSGCSSFATRFHSRAVLLK